MRVQIMTLVLAVSRLLIADAGLSQDTKKFSLAWQNFSQSYTKINQVNDIFTSQVAPHLSNIDNYRAWMDETTKRLSADEVGEQELTLAFNQYRDFLKDDTTCSGAGLQTLQHELQLSLKELKLGLQELKAIARSAATADRKTKSQMVGSIADAEKFTQKAEATIESYSEKIISSNICKTMSSYDLFLVAAETLYATLNSPSPLFLMSYLSNQNTEQSPDRIKLEAKAYLQAIEDSFEANLKSGNIAKSLILFNRIEGNIAFGTSAVKRLSEADRQEIEGLKAKTKSALMDLAGEYKFQQLEGMQAMVEKKAIATHLQLTSVERTTVRASDQGVFAQIKDSSDINLDMKMSKPYRLPNLKTLEEILDFEAKLSDVQYLLTSLVISGRLASPVSKNR